MDLPTLGNLDGRPALNAGSASYPDNVTFGAQSTAQSSPTITNRPGIQSTQSTPCMHTYSSIYSGETRQCYVGAWTTDIRSRNLTRLDSRSVSYRHHKSPVYGYPDLARHMGERDGHAIFRRFAGLNTRMLLYSQAELLELEEELDILERENANEKVHGYNIQYDTKYLRGHYSDHPNLQNQWEVVRLIKEKLKEYNRLILEHRQLYQLPEPSATEVEDIYDFIANSNTNGERRIEFDDLERTVWEHDGKKPREKDLISLSGEPQDMLTTFLRETMINIIDSVRERWRRFKGLPEQNRTYSGKAIEKTANFLTIIVASVLPTASIFALNYIQSTSWRLAFITIWAAVFSSALAFFTSASRIEIFSASVAMAAVQVVFIGNNVVEVVARTSR